MIYDSEFICTYKQMDTPEEQEQLYKVQLLQAFRLEEWDDTKVTNALFDLYTLMNVDTQLENILQKISQVDDLQLIINMANENIDEDDEDDIQLEKNLILFNLLFKYEYFDFFHRCIYDFLHGFSIKEKSKNELLNNL